jgi:hypothetical protein
MRNLLTATVACAFGWCVTSCLPADTRPPPATVRLAVGPSDASRRGTTTADGWIISFDRLLVGIGEASVGDSCISYSDAGYSRLVDGNSAEEQKLALLFGLGHCGLDYRIASPAPDTLLGVGVTQAEAVLLATRDVDRYVTQPAGISVDLTASASRDSVTKRLHWSFRQRLNYRNCETPVDGKPVTPLEFSSNADLAYHIALAPESLFLDDAVSSRAAPRFDVVAAADTTFGNGDGDITLDELGSVSLDVARQAGPYGIGDADPTKVISLEDFVYIVLLPMISHFSEPIVCETTIGRRFD